MIDCRKCERWKECTGQAYYEYQDIRWCVYQVAWLLIHSETLLRGEWPDDPNKAETGYTGGNGNRPHEARFVKSALVIGELEARLKTTGKAGKRLREVLSNGSDIADLDRELYDVLMYVKGNKYKRLSFSAWKKQRRYRKNEAILSR